MEIKCPLLTLKNKKNSICLYWLITINFNRMQKLMCSKRMQKTWQYDTFHLICYTCTLMCLSMTYCQIYFIQFLCSYSSVYVIRILTLMYLIDARAAIHINQKDIFLMSLSYVIYLFSYIIIGIINIKLNIHLDIILQFY